MKLCFVFDKFGDGVDFPISLQVDPGNILQVGPKHGSTTIWNLWRKYVDDEMLTDTIEDYISTVPHSHWVWRPTDEALESGHNEVLRKFMNKKLGFSGNKDMPIVDRFDHVHDYLKHCWGLNSDQPNDYHCRMDFRLAMRRHFKEGDRVVKLQELSDWLEKYTTHRRHDYKNDFYNFPVAYELSFDYYKTYIIKKHNEWYAKQLEVDILVEKYYENQ